MKVDVRTWGSHAAGLAWVALRSFSGTVLVLTLFGCVLAAGSYYFFRNAHWAYGAVAMAVALAESVATGVLLGVKRAGVMTLARGLGALRLGSSLVRLVFERILGVSEEQGVGKIGGQLERLPLAQAEERLRGAIQKVTGDGEQVGWLRRRIRARLAEAVRKYTLARFRAEGAAHGGVDLLKVKEDLEQNVDDALVQKIRGGLRFWTTLVVLGLPAAVAVQTWVALLLLHAK